MSTTLPREDLFRLAQIVREETGNLVLEKNFHMLESRIRIHMMKLGLPSFNEYWAHFARNEEEERVALQSLMTTHHTFFFREFEHFEVLANWIDSESPRLKERFQKTQTPVRVWSAACSRGQEVYSLAMFLELHLFKKSGIPFEILGTDIDVESIAYAQNGVYPIKEANTIPQKYLNGYWKKGTGPIKDFAAVHSNLKSKVRFLPLNLLKLDEWPERQSYDVVFCRNVFIYFSEDNIRKIAKGLTSRLDKNGLFVSGVSEPLRFPDWDLKIVGPSCYRFHKEIPAAAETSVTSSSKPIAVLPKMPPERRYRVLCVDDSSTIQTLMKRIFGGDPECAGIETAANGQEARAKLDQGKYDLITLDIHMPVVNGIEFLERFYSRKTDPPVIMVSSVNRTDLDLATKSMALGAFDYVEKPAMNNLQKSADEILTKARMALRAKTLMSEGEALGSFDASIGKKIVVHDASQCLRVVVASRASILQVEQVVRGQDAEYRSPPLLIVWSDEAKEAPLERELLKWSQRQIVTLREQKIILKPNQIFLIDSDKATAFLKDVRAKSASLQILDKNMPDLAGLKGIAALQVLVDETLSSQLAEIKVRWRVSDLTPAISFSSLSAEFFANLRKASA